MFYTYILECMDGSYYTGWTNDLDHRFYMHRMGRGAKYTKSHIPLRIAYFELSCGKKEAQRKEWRIKQMHRKQKEELIRNPLKNHMLFDEQRLKRKKFLSKILILYHPESGKVLLELDEITAEGLIGSGQFIRLETTDDAFWESHEPVISRDAEKLSVKIGSDLHPMIAEHMISFVILQYEKGCRVVYFEPGDEPVVDFYPGEPVKAVYAYCAQHGLWKMEV